MDLKDSCIILLDKSTQKVKCFKFLSKELERELAVHEHADHKGVSTISDIKTGMAMFSLNVPPSKITENSISEGLNNFIKHYTTLSIQERFNELDKTTMQEKLDKGKKK